jgi:F-type H+-transporting ATPase subunit b
VALAIGALLAGYGSPTATLGAAPSSATAGILLAQAGGEHGAATGHGAASHEAEGQPNFLEPQPSLAIWTVVVFIGLLLVLGRFAWKPLLAALHEREAHLESVLLDTERARNEAEALLAEHRRLMSEAQDKVRAMLDAARHESRVAADEITTKAQAEAEAARHRAERDIATARDQALVELWSRAADLAVSVAGKVLARDLGPDEHRRLIETATSELPVAPPAHNGHGQGGAPA